MRILIKAVGNQDPIHAKRLPPEAVINIGQYMRDYLLNGEISQTTGADFNHNLL